MATGIAGIGMGGSAVAAGSRVVAAGAVVPSDRTRVGACRADEGAVPRAALEDDVTPIGVEEVTCRPCAMPLT